MIEDYNIYKLTAQEKVVYVTQGIVIVLVISFLFYGSLIGSVILSPLIFVFVRRKKLQLRDSRKWNLNLEFKDGILSLSSALHAGYSVEKAFDEALTELKHLYGDKGQIVNEFTYLANQIKLNITVEKALMDFGRRTSVEDIISFAQVFVTAKRAGGDLIRIIKTTGDTISDKIEVKREVLTLITAKKLEANIMKIVPIGILLYMRLFSPGYLNPLYHNLIGIVVMTILLIIYLIAFLIIDKIIDIDI